MPTVKNMEGGPVTKKPKKIGKTVTGKEKIAVKVAEISPKIKKNLDKMTVVSKKIKVEKEKLKKAAPKLIKNIEIKTAKTKTPQATTTPKTSKKINSKSPERKNDKVETPLTPKPKKIKKEPKETKEPKDPKESKKKAEPKTKKDGTAKTKKPKIPKEQNQKPDETVKDPKESPEKGAKAPQKKSENLEDALSPKPKSTKKSEPKVKKEPKEPITLKTPQQSIIPEEPTGILENNLDKTKKLKPKPKNTAEKAKTPKKPKVPNSLKTPKPKAKPLEKIDETELINNIIQKVKDDVAKSIKKEKIIKTEPIESTETIAKLIKVANKTILKGTKKPATKPAQNKTTAIKKPKVSKPKTVDIKQEYEEEVDLSELKQIAKALKAAKVQKESGNQKTIEEAPQETINPPTIVEVVERNLHPDDSDELTLDVVRQNHKTESKVPNTGSKKMTKKIKVEPTSDSDRKEISSTKKVKVVKKKPKVVKKITPKKKVSVLKKRLMKARLKGLKGKDSSEESLGSKGKKIISKKLYNFWNGPKRHRVASLNAIAKVHCLYENESRGAMLDMMKRSVVVQKEPKEVVSSDPEVEQKPEVPEAPTRTLRSVPGLRGAGKHWEINLEDLSSFSSDNESSMDVPKKFYTLPPSYKQKQKAEAKKEKKPTVKKEKVKKKVPEVEEDDDDEEVEEEEEEDEVEEVERGKESSKGKQKKKVIRKKRPRTELIMDLKDMVVRKRMASLNASAILAASYSVEKKPLRSPKTDETTSESDSSIDSDVSSDKKRKCYDSDVKKEEDRKVIEVHASPNKKVAVILNQDTDVTITGVYVNSTTRSAHHEGYCSIAGMQYRISATSHTQTNATAVATETLLHSGTEHRDGDAQPPRSYTPLSALSKMQPPGTHHGVPVGPVGSGDLSPGGRRHGCPSAFSAPPGTVYGPPPPPPHHAPPHPHMHGHHRHGPIPEHPQPYMHGKSIFLPHGFLLLV